MKKKYKNLKQYFNKGISTPVAIFVVSLVVIAVGVLAWQFWPEEEVVAPSPSPTLSPSPSPTPSEPYIKVIFPNGGEELVIGEKYQITWESSPDVLDVTIYIAGDDQFGDVIAKYVLPSGEYEWDVDWSIEEKCAHVIVEGWDAAAMIASDSSDACFSIIFPDETADWEVYRNEEYGFEVKYPLDWKMEIKTGTSISWWIYQEGSRPLNVLWSKEEDDPSGGERWITFSICTTAKPDNSFNEAMENECALWGITERLKVDGRDAIRCMSPTGPAGTDRRWLIKDGIGWDFFIGGFYNEELEKVAEQMFSTFKFIE